MYPVVDASYLMSSSPPQFRCLNCSASQVCSQESLNWMGVGHTRTLGAMTLATRWNVLIGLSQPGPIA